MLEDTIIETTQAVRIRSVLCTRCSSLVQVGKICVFSSEKVFSCKRSITQFLSIKSTTYIGFSQLGFPRRISVFKSCDVFLFCCKLVEIFDVLMKRN